METSSKDFWRFQTVWALNLKKQSLKCVKNQNIISFQKIKSSKIPANNINYLTIKSKEIPKWYMVGCKSVGSSSSAGF